MNNKDGRKMQCASYSLITFDTITPHPGDNDWFINRKIL